MPFLTIEATGHIKPIASNSTPPGYLPCNGQTVSQSSYPSLYAVISNTFNTGGEPVGTFRLPDLRGKIRVGSGQDTLRGLSSRIPGQYLGNETHSLTSAELPPHTHSGTTGTSADAHTHTGGSSGSVNLSHTHYYYGTGARGDGNNCSPGRPVGYYSFPDTTSAVDSGSNSMNLSHTHTVSVTALNSTHSHSSYTTDTGFGTSGSAHNNMGVSAAVYYYIKY